MAFKFQCFELKTLPGVEVDSSHKKGLEGVAGGFKNRVGVPECNLLLQFVRNLAEKVYLESQPHIICIVTSEKWRPAQRASSSNS